MWQTWRRKVGTVELAQRSLEKCGGTDFWVVGESSPRLRRAPKCIIWAWQIDYLERFQGNAARAESSRTWKR